MDSNIDKLRDEFAMAAVTGILSKRTSPGFMSTNTIEEIARDAYHIADAMLRIRKPLKVVKDGS